MTSIEGAISDDYSDYSFYCKNKNIKPIDLYGKESFYETTEWKKIEKIPHIRGCIGMALDKIILDNAENK